ncbi:amidohydrolase family protein [Rhodococcus sp. OK519]|uniref:amidohydrolase family protein n=1 Tax=Rhodococcus sp. OK519 TaxID=2135729 RepID=UPI000D3CD5A4
MTVELHGDPSLQVIDCHTHVQRSTDHGQELWEYFLSRTPMNGFEAEPPTHGTTSDLLAMMSDLGVVHANILMFTWSGRYWRDGLRVLPDRASARGRAMVELRHRVCDRISDNNTWAAATCAQAAGLSFFCGVDPVLMRESELIAELDRTRAAGARGVKIVPFDLQITGADERLWPVYDWCARHQVPLLSESGSRETSPGRPRYFEAALREFPDLTVIFAHMGHSSTLGEAGDAEVLDLATRFEGVYTDVSLRFNDVASGAVSPMEMVEHLRRIGIDRVLYGSNFPFCDIVPDHRSAQEPHRRAADAVSVLRTLPLTDSERALVASGNFERLTGPVTAGSDTAYVPERSDW